MKRLIDSPKFVQWAAPALVGAVLLTVWELTCWYFQVREFLIPRPSVIAQTLVQDFGMLVTSLWVTLKITLAAFVLATVIGSLIAFLFVQSRWIELSLFPYAVLLQVTPIAAIAPLIIIWIKDTMVALTVCATIIAIFPVIANTTLGLRSVNPGLASLFRMQRATRLQTLVRLRIPSALPYWFAGLRIASGLSLIGAVVSEFVAGTGGQGAGLAYQILQAGFQINIPRLFAALLLISVAGIALFAAMSVAGKVAIGDWHDSESQTES
ncbi:ABC transporter permease [Limnohabitans sp.]|jgi:NitT/TauT family transport system permease protein|uniref:ABC transporter permease n=1 Tax=Limnohabitans sp. TaxID=1907725 RepID=UPI00286ED581|nr:ABC transporter permease [Limnohabitans sp.]